eukprot:TRINITY_DN685_c5_g1_i1.p1 TRINITY_DN685_c5_g1~~TRINITY_DN685_c5_g1_i1.p1  ORF type:complete len:420 (+),score=109.01 TRINITY_DN685_c5_g1_i1:84-1262(+)
MRAPRAAAALCLWTVSCLACTSVRVGGKAYGGGAEVVGRTMEVGQGPPVSDWNITVHGRGEKMGTLTSKLSQVLCRNGSSLTWTNKYLFTGIESQDMESGFIPEGMNEAGLTVSGLTLRMTEYSNIPPSKTSKSTMCHVMLLPYLLGTCATVQEAKAAVDSLNVVDTVPSQGFLKFHFSMSDANGSHAILEYINGAPIWHDDELGVLTNDPEYNWHVENLDNYVALSRTLPGPAPASATSPQPAATSFGTNLLGLPGDLSPPSRFVRMYFLRQFALETASGGPSKYIPSWRDWTGGVSGDDDGNVVLVQSLLNTVHIVRGTVAKRVEGPMPEMTHWSVLKIPERKLFYVRTYSDMVWQMVDVAELAGSDGYRSIHLDEQGVTVANVTAHLKR